MREVKDLASDIEANFGASFHGRRAKDGRWEGKAFRLGTFHDKLRSLLHSESRKRPEYPSLNNLIKLFNFA